MSSIPGLEHMTYEMVEAEQLSRDLKLFVPQAWAQVEPATTYISGWHIDAICEHLMALTRLEIRNLIINIPPRHMKSMSVGVFWPSWVWTFAPQSKFFFTSYAETLAQRDGASQRRLVQSKWYQDRWGKKVQLNGDQNTKERYTNTMGGERISMGVGGQVTGFGGDYLIADDPHKAQEADSDKLRKRVINFWKETMSTRGNDPKTVRKVIIMQRLHQSDLVGEMIEEMAHGGETYEHLKLPAEYEGDKHVTSIDWSDPRTEPNELLWPERFGREEIDKLKTNLGPSGTAGQLQQRPAPRGGAIYLRKYWETDATRYTWPVTEQYDVVAKYMMVDTALKEGERNDYSACTVWSMLADYRLALTDAWREKVDFPGLIDGLTAMASKQNADGKLRGIIIEDKQSGTSAVQTLKKLADPWLARLVVAFPIAGDKTYRARIASGWASKGGILLPHPCAEAPWLYDLEQELFTFPASANDDYCDTVSEAAIYLENFLVAWWAALLKRRAKGR